MMKNLLSHLSLRREKCLGVLYITDFATPFTNFLRYDDRRDYTFYKYRATDVPTSCSNVESTTDRIIDSGMLITRTRRAL